VSSVLHDHSASYFLTDQNAASPLATSAARLFSIPRRRSLFSHRCSRNELTLKPARERQTLAGTKSAMKNSSTTASHVMKRNGQSPRSKQFLINHRSDMGVSVRRQDMCFASNSTRMLTVYEPKPNCHTMPSTNIIIGNGLQTIHNFSHSYYCLSCSTVSYFLFCASSVLHWFYVWLIVTFGQ
jgi:hypothetical protein